MEDSDLSGRRRGEFLLHKEAQARPMGELERSLVAECRRDTRHRAKQRRAFVVRAVTAAAVLLVSLVWAGRVHRAELAERDAHRARQVAEQTIAQAELARGRAALLHGDADVAVTASTLGPRVMAARSPAADTAGSAEENPLPAGAMAGNSDVQLGDPR